MQEYARVDCSVGGFMSVRNSEWTGKREELSQLYSYSPWADPWHRGVGGRGAGMRIFDRCTIGLRTCEPTYH